jgi:hypothetical protein
MEKFTKFEYQYIVMLAFHARQDLKKMLEENSGYIDPNIPSYIESLESIINKAKNNIKSE